MELNKIKNIQITFSPELKTKLDTITKEYDIEMLGYLTGEKTDYGYHCDGLLIPEQKATGTHCSIDAKAMQKMFKEYGRQACGRIVGHFHSHVKMGCFWSATDIGQQEEYANGREETIFCVGSKGEYLFRLIVSKPFLIMTDNIELAEELDQEVLDELEKKVERQVAVTPVTTYDWSKYDGEFGAYGIDGGIKKTKIPKIQMPKVVYFESSGYLTVNAYSQEQFLDLETLFTANASLPSLNKSENGMVFFLANASKETHKQVQTIVDEYNAQLMEEEIDSPAGLDNVAMNSGIPTYTPPKNYYHRGSYYD